MENFKELSKILINIIKTTQIDDQEKLVDISKIMHESSKISPEYTPKMVEDYLKVHELLRKLSPADFKKVLKIANNS